MNKRARSQAAEVTSWKRLQPLMVSLALLFVGFSVGFFSSWALQEQSQGAQAAERVRLEDQRVQEVTLEAYRNQMRTYIRQEGLRDSNEGEKVRSLARAQTLTVLGRLGPEGKGSVVRFLHEASLIDKERPLVDLGEADLSEAELGLAELRGADLGLADLDGADLHAADLSDAYLAATYLSEVDLSNANLSGADLSYAYLWKAKVTEEQLDESQYLKGAIMPDGRRHS
jgi:pentapeptide repeat protein